jgi:hypothetical protein
MHVTYGRERSKTARRATVDISPEFGTTRAGRRSGRTPRCLHNNCRRKELCAIALRHPQMSPFPVSINGGRIGRCTVGGSYYIRSAHRAVLRDLDTEDHQNLAIALINETGASMSGLGRGNRIRQCAISMPCGRLVAGSAQ